MNALSAVLLRREAGILVMIVLFCLAVGAEKPNFLTLESLRIVLDAEACTGHGRCYALTPTLFVDDERGFGQVKDDGTVAPGLEQDARRAVGSCPENAITIEQ